MRKRCERRKLTDELRREYDLSKVKGGVRGKYATRFQTEPSRVNSLSLPLVQKIPVSSVSLTRSPRNLKS
jgi:hypothetical protein